MKIPRLERLHGVTLLEIVVVLLIISILSTVTIQVYTGHVQRARVAKARFTIAELELAASRYEIDLGTFPLSSTGDPVFPVRPTRGCGFLMVALRTSVSLDTETPASPYWNGPYIEVDYGQLGSLDGVPFGSEDSSGAVVGFDTGTPMALSLLDPWGTPYYYTRHDDYTAYGGTEQIDEDGHPSIGVMLGERYFNPSSMQIVSFGPNRVTEERPRLGLGTDDINNFFTP